MCSHEQTIEDLAEGCIVCLDCAVVMMDRMPLHAEELHSAKSQLEPPQVKNQYHQDNSENDSFTNRDPLNRTIDWLFNANLSPILAQDVVLLYQESLSKVMDGAKLRQQDAQHILAFCLYTILKKEGMARTFRDIAGITGSSVRHLSNVCKRWRKNQRISTACKLATSSRCTDPVQPSDLLQRIGRIAGFDGKQLESVNHWLLSSIITDSSHPATIASSYLFCYAQKQGLSISLTDICQAANISEVAVRRYARRYLLH